MTEMWINRHSDHLCVDIFEFIGFVAEGYDLCWADKGAEKQAEMGKNKLQNICDGCF